MIPHKTLFQPRCAADAAERLVCRLVKRRLRPDEPCARAVPVLLILFTDPLSRPQAATVLFAAVNRVEVALRLVRAVSHRRVKHADIDKIRGGNMDVGDHPIFKQAVVGPHPKIFLYRCHAPALRAFGVRVVPLCKHAAVCSLHCGGHFSLIQKCAAARTPAHALFAILARRLCEDVRAEEPLHILH